MRRLSMIVVIAFMICACPALAQAEEGDYQSPIAEFVGSSFSSAASTFYQMILDSTETINRLYGAYIDQHARLSLLRDLNINFKTFHQNGDSTDASLGFSYQYSRDIQRSLISHQSSKAIGFTASFNAEGNVAFESGTNPNDFLSTSFALHFFRSSGGAIVNTDSLLRDRLNELGTASTRYDDPDELATSPEWKEFSSIVRDYLSTQFYLDLALSAALESNQDFTQKQWAYGCQLGIDLKAWNHTSSLAMLNVFDWAPALFRVLTGYDRQIRPRGSSIPTLLFALEQVDPVRDTLRMNIDPDDANYPRVRAEVAFRTPISRTADLMANARLYKELSASDAIGSAGVDEFKYLAVAVSMSNGFYVSYTTGRLPFDHIDDQVYAIGFNYKLR